ncbi:unnamed protein product [Camellia sinensis]
MKLLICMRIGSHLHLLKPPLHRTFHQISQNLGSIFSLRFGSHFVMMVSSPSVVEECFTKNDIVLANRPQLITGEYIDYNNTTVSASPLRRPVAQPPPPHVTQNLLHELTQHVLIGPKRQNQAPPPKSVSKFVDWFRKSRIEIKVFGAEL